MKQTSAAMPKNIFEAIGGAPLQLNTGRDAAPLGARGNFAGYNPRTRAPVGKEFADMTFEEATGLPFDVQDENESVADAARRAGLAGSFRQASKFIRASDAPNVPKNAHMPVLKGLQRTGATEFMNYLGIKTAATPPTGRSLKCDDSWTQKDHDLPAEWASDPSNPALSILPSAISHFSY